MIITGDRVNTIEMSEHEVIIHLKNGEEIHIEPGRDDKDDDIEILEITKRTFKTEMLFPKKLAVNPTLSQDQVNIGTCRCCGKENELNGHNLCYDCEVGKNKPPTDPRTLCKDCGLPHILNEHGRCANCQFDLDTLDETNEWGAD